MQKFAVRGDNSSNPFHSSRIIIDGINKGAKNIGLYDENGVCIVYDVLCNHHNHNPDAFISVYETLYPNLILNNAGGKPILGVSRDNMFFILQGGYPSYLLDYFHLGVDSQLWLNTKRKNGGKFRFLCLTDSNIRCCLEVLVPAFCNAFRDSQEVELYIKDREPTDLLKQWVAQRATEANLNIIHDGRHIEDREIEKDIYSSADCHIYLNHSTTFGLTVLQGMSMGLPTISIAYSGPRDYLNDGFNGLAVDFVLERITEEKIKNLVGIGMRNFMFPPTKDFFRMPPCWAQPKIESVETKMKQVFENKNLRDWLGYSARVTAESFSWERSAANLSLSLKQWFNK